MAIGKIFEDAVFPKEGWYGVDLDETLAYYFGPIGNTEIGDPVMDIFLIVRKWLDEGKDVRLLTARASFPEEVPKIESWLTKYGIEKVVITNVKSPGMVMLLDDKAREVASNTGIIIGGLRDQVKWR